MDARDVARSSDVLLAKIRCHPTARNHRARTPSADGEMATLVAPAQLQRMSLRDGELAAS